jgi:hypothetical protein
VRFILIIALLLSLGCVRHVGPMGETTIFVEGKVEECVIEDGETKCLTVEVHYSMSAAFAKIFLTTFGWIPGVG